MPNNETITLMSVLLLGFVFTLVGTPLLRRVAARHGLVDAPDGRRGHQKQPVPLAGGLALFPAVLLAVGGVLLTGPGDGLLADDARFGSLLVAAMVIGLVGFLDDARGLRGRHKLYGQILAISILVAAGHLHIQQLVLFGWHLDLGPFGIIATYAWMLAVINALNLIDGMDGLLATIAAFVSVTFAAIATLNGQGYIALLACALTGALLAFLLYNRPPASVYLGDCGSMMIGLVLGALAVQGSLKGPAAMTLAGPVALLILPLLDTAAAITRRKLTGRSIYSTDRGHLHHCLLRSGLNRSAVLVLVAVLGVLTSTGVISSIVFGNDLFAVLSAAAVVVLLVVTRLFGYAEFHLLKVRCRGLLMAQLHGRTAERSHQLEVRLQGTAQWQEIWEELAAAAFQFDLRSLCLDVNAPALHEGYHARWDRYGAGEEEALHEWRAEMPLTLNGQVIGRLTAAGVCADDPIWIKLTQMAEIIKHAEWQAHRLTAAPSAAPPLAAAASPTPLAGSAV